MSDDAIRERDEARAEEELLHELSQRQGSLLTGAINVLRGEPPRSTLWSHHDIVEHAKRVVAERDEARAQLAALRESARELLDAMGRCVAGDPDRQADVQLAESVLTRALADTAAATQEHDERVRREALREAAHEWARVRIDVDYTASDFESWLIRVLAEEGE